MSDQEHLLERFVAAFGKNDDMIADKSLDPVAWSLVTGPADELGFRHWWPIKVNTPRSCLEDIYARLPARFPPLFESLVLSYRWAEVDLGEYRLLANPPGVTLQGLLEEMSRDKALWTALIPAGLIQFGRGPDVCYDPVCFDIQSRNRARDYRILKVDHEEILCNSRLRVVAELAPSFSQLVLDTVGMANGA